MAMEQLTAIGWGLVTFGLIIGVGMLVLQKFGDAVVTCGLLGGNTSTWNASSQLCTLTNGSTLAGSGQAYTNMGYIMTQLGSTGLASYIPLIIIIVIAGLIFLYFGKGKKY